MDEPMMIAGRIAKPGWRVVFHVEAVDLSALIDVFAGRPTTIVVDRIGQSGYDEARGR